MTKSENPLCPHFASKGEKVKKWRVRLQELYCAVELHGTLTRGMSTFDWNQTLERSPNVSLVKRINLEGFNAMMDASTD